MAAPPDAGRAASPDDATRDPYAPRLADHGIRPIVLPAANDMRTVNAWLVDDDPLTLVDAGTRGPEALATLEAAVRSAGRRLEDVGLVVLTHHHADHLGLVGEVVRRSGADVAALAPVAGYLGDYDAATAADRDFSAALLARHGADDALVERHRAGWAAFHRVAERADVTVPLTAGARLTLRDRTLELLHRPGHCETDVLLVDAERRMLFGGDHVLAGGPSVPVRDRPLAHPGPYAPDADDVAVLRRYRESLRATSGLPVDVVLPGHGAAFGDLDAVVDAHLRRQERDADRVLARAGTEPVSAMALTQRLWPAADGPMAFVLLSSVLGALGLLAASGRARRADDDGAVRFVAV